MLGVYIHWPFCLSRCSYCGFASGTDLSLTVPYTRALLAEIRAVACRVHGPADTVFFGGGTPSLCRPELLGQIMEAVRAEFSLRADAEITAEVNPRSALPEWLAAARAAGINRISLGLQAAQDSLLQLLGRRQTAQMASEACEQIRQAGFDNLNLDLIYGVPGQTMRAWLETLEFACSLSPQHLSLYALSLESGTPLEAAVADGCLPEPDDDLTADMYVLARSVLAGHGFRQYEISNFARPGFVCRHNMKYWTLEDYLGVGAAACSMIGRRRLANIPDTAAYISAVLESGTACSDCENVVPAEREREFLMLRTRLTAGFSPAEFAEATGVPWDEAARPGLQRALADGLLRYADGRYLPTGLGLRLQNRLALLLMDDV